VWEIIAGSIGSIRSTLSADDTDDTLREIMKPFVRKLIDPQLARLTWEEIADEPHLDKLLRPLIIGLAAAADEPNIIDEIKMAYKKRLNSGEGSINPDLRGVVYSTIARIGGQREYDELLSMYQVTKSSDEKLSLTAGMTSFEQLNIIDEVLELIKSDIVRTQDNGYWIAYSFMNRHGRAATWDWTKKNWNWMEETMGTDLSFSRMPIYAARSFADEKHIKDYQLFFEDKLNPTIERTYNQGLEVAQTSAAWRLRDKKIVLEWFKAHKFND
jgi:aminopeptidase N